MSDDTMSTDEPRALMPQGNVSALHHVLVACEAGDEEQMILALQELCTNLCLAGGNFFGRRHSESECVSGLLNLLLAEDSELVQVLVMRALGLIADLVPRAAHLIVKADGVPVLLGSFSSRAYFNANGFRDDLFKCLEVVSFVAHTQLVAENALQLIIGQLEVGDEHQRVLLTKTLGNLFALADQSEEEFFAHSLQTLFALLSAKLSNVMLDNKESLARSSAEGQLPSLPSASTMPRNFRLREEDIVLKLLACFAYFIDRLIVSPDKFCRHATLLKCLLELCTKIIHDGEQTLQGEQFRLAAVTIISSLFLVAPQHVVQLYDKTSILQTLCATTLTLLEETMNDPRLGLASSTAVETDAQDDGSVPLTRQDSSSALPAQRSDGGGSFLPSNGTGISALLELLLLLIPAAPGTFDAHSVTIPFYAWHWMDDYRNKTEFEEDLSRRLECEYRLQRDSRSGLGTYELVHTSRPCLIRFSDMSCKHHGTDSHPWCVVRSPLCGGFLHRPAMGLLFDQCTCPGSTPRYTPQNQPSDDDDDTSSSSSRGKEKPEVNNEVLREWIITCRRQDAEHRRHRIQPKPPLDIKPPDPRLLLKNASSGEENGPDDRCCCFLGRLFSSTRRNNGKQGANLASPPAPSLDHLRRPMPSSISRYRDMREEVLLDPGLRGLYVNHGVVGILVRNCVPMLFTVLRCSVSQVITRHASLLLLRCISLVGSLDQVEGMGSPGGKDDTAPTTTATTCDASNSSNSNAGAITAMAATPVLRVTRDSEANTLVLDAFRSMISDILVALAGVVKGTTPEIATRASTHLLAASPQLAHMTKHTSILMSREGLAPVHVLTVQSEALLAACMSVHLLDTFLPPTGSSVRTVFAQQRAIHSLQVASMSILTVIAGDGRVLSRTIASPPPCVFHTTKQGIFREIAHAMSFVIQQVGGGSVTSQAAAGGDPRPGGGHSDDDNDDEDHAAFSPRSQRSGGGSSSEMLGIVASPVSRTLIKTSLPCLPDSAAIEQLLQLSNLVVECQVPLNEIHRRNPTYFGITARAIKNQLGLGFAGFSTTVAHAPSNIASNLTKQVACQLLALCLGLMKTIGTYVNFANSVLSEPVTISQVTPTSSKSVKAFADQSPVVQCIAERLSRPLRLRLVPFPASAVDPAPLSPSTADQDKSPSENGPPGATPACSLAAEAAAAAAAAIGHFAVGGQQFFNVLPLSKDFSERLMPAYSFATLKSIAKELVKYIQEEGLLIGQQPPLVGSDVCDQPRRISQEGAEGERLCMCALLGTQCEHCEQHQRRRSSLPVSSPVSPPAITEDSIVFIVDGYVIQDSSMKILDAIMSHASSGALLKKLVENPSNASRSVLHRAINTWVSHHTIHFLVLGSPRPFSPLSTICCSFRIMHNSSRLKSSGSSDPTSTLGGGLAMPSGTCSSKTPDYMCSPRHIYTSLKASNAGDFIDECLQLLDATLAVLRLPSQCLSLGPDARRLCNALLREVSSHLLSYAVPCLSGLCHVGAHTDSLEDSLPSYVLWNYPQVFPVALRNVVFDMVVRAGRQMMPKGGGTSLHPASSHRGNHNHNNRSINSGAIGAVWADGVTDFATVKNIKKVVRRDQLLQDGSFLLQHFDSCPVPLEISFEGEPGTGIGPSYEFYMCLCRELQKKSLGLWRCEDDFSSPSSSNPLQAPVNDSHGLFPNPCCDTAALQRHFRLIGCIMARMLVEGRTFNLNLHPLLYWRLLGHDLTENPSAALGSLDGQLEASLQRLLELNHDDFEDLGMRWTVPGHDAIELVPHGADIMLDGSSVHSYVDAVRRYYLVRLVEPAVGAMLEGISALFAPAHLQLYSLPELVLRLRGPEGKVWNSRAQLEAIVRTDHGYTASSPVIGYFLDTVASWSASNQRLFLRFISGSDRMPPGGLSPAITIVRKDPNPDATPSRASRMRAAASAASQASQVTPDRVSPPEATAEREPSAGEFNNNASFASASSMDTPTDVSGTPLKQRLASSFQSEYQEQADESLPTVNTCFHYLKLPRYSSREVTEERLLVAIREGQESFLLS